MIRRRSWVVIGSLVAISTVGLIAVCMEREARQRTKLSSFALIGDDLVHATPRSCQAGKGVAPPLLDGKKPDWERDPYLGCNGAMERREASSTGPMTHGWMLLEDDEEKIFSAIDEAARYGVDHIELSHSIIKNIDPVLEDDDLVDLINEVTRRAGEAKVYLWTHEFNDTGIEICFPDPGAFSARQEAYRRALARVPGVAGIVLTLVSTDVKPFEARCRCEPCAGPAGELYTPDPPTRVIMSVNALAEVIHDELGHELWLRTFTHHPWELEWMGVALRDAGLHPAVKVISKEVPQDWQPYYPDNPVIGRVEGRQQLVELDVAGEYWGLSITPAVMIDYLAWRLPRLLHHATGAVVRIERKSHSVLGTVNEANLFAVSQLLAHPPASRQRIWDQWLERRYALRPGSGPAATLQSILASTFRISMQTHYLLGFWVMSKGSDLPKSAERLELLEQRSLARWTPGWVPNHMALAEPGEDTLIRIWQEKTEAVFQARANLAAFGGIRSELADADAEELQDLLARQEAAARAWRLAADIAVRYQRWSRENGSVDRTLIQRHQTALLGLADEIEGRWRDRDPLPTPKRIRGFARSLPRPFSRPKRHDEPLGETRTFEPPLISDIAVRREGKAICVDWQSTLPGVGHLAHATDSPEGVWMPAEFAAREPSETPGANRHRACIPAPEAAARLLLKAEVELADGRILTATPVEVFHSGGSGVPPDRSRR
jgi:hypothetical protein